MTHLAEAPDGGENGPVVVEGVGYSQQVLSVYVQYHVHSHVHVVVRDHLAIIVCHHPPMLPNLIYAVLLDVIVEVVDHGVGHVKVVKECMHL
jgi:hypothetical protein